MKDVVINERENRNDQKITVDLHFDDLRVVLTDTPRLAMLTNIPQDGIFYNHALLAMYLIRDPQDTAPRLLFPMFILITLLASVSLIMIVHNAFALSMNAKIHQIGILSSIGATPKQLLTCLLQEAAALCAIPVLGGNLLGIAGCAGFTALIPDARPHVRCGRGTGRKRSESPKEGIADGVLIFGPLLHGLYNYAVLFCYLRNQHEGNLL